MKKSTVFFILVIVLVIGLLAGNKIWKSTPKYQELTSKKDSIAVVQKAIADSLQKAEFVRADSIAKEREKERIAAEKERKAKEAYENRPWKSNFFVDDFGDKTKKGYVQHNFSGTFSNSAVSQRALYDGHIIVDTDEHVGIFLTEYAGHSAESFIGDATLKCKNSDGVIRTYSMDYKWSNKGGQSVNSFNGDSRKLVAFIKGSSGYMDCYISTEYSSTYSFKINCNGFTAEYAKIKP